MVRRVTPSQFQSLVRQAQAKRRQAVNDYNRKVREHNAKVRQARDKFNRSVDSYNREVRAFNARQRADRQRVQTAIRRLQQAPTRTVQRHVVYRTSTTQLHQRYVEVERRAAEGHYGPEFNTALDWVEREVANSADVANALDEAAEVVTPGMEADPQLLSMLNAVSDDLGSRWQGALFSLDERNPDASRHFCTSARELFNRIFDLKAPDTAAAALPGSELTPQGKPTRRTKIKYILAQSGLSDDVLESFVEEDMENVVSLFHVFNDGTHGTAGKFSLGQLLTIKKRVQDGLSFILRLALGRVNE